MLPDLDKMVYSSTTSALRNFGSGEFSISISGTIAPSATATSSGSTSFTRANSQVRLYVRQSPVPNGTAVDYVANTLLPCPPYGSNGFAPFVWVGCSVSGSPSVSIIDAAFKIQFTSSGINITVSVTNPFAGTMTLTATTFTFRYVAFLST